MEPTKELSQFLKKNPAHKISHQLWSELCDRFRIGPEEIQWRIDQAKSHLIRGQRKLDRDGINEALVDFNRALQYYPLEDEALLETAYCYTKLFQAFEEERTKAEGLEILDVLERRHFEVIERILISLCDKILI